MLTQHAAESSRIMHEIQRVDLVLEVCKSLRGTEEGAMEICSRSSRAESDISLVRTSVYADRTH